MVIPVCGSGSESGYRRFVGFICFSASRIWIRIHFSQRYGSGSGSSSGLGSFCHQAKIVRKTLIPTDLWLLNDFLSLKNKVRCTFKKAKNLEEKNFLSTSWRSLMWIAGSGSEFASGSNSQRYGAAYRSVPKFHLFTSVQIRIQIFTFIHIKIWFWILLLIRMLQICDHWSTDPPSSVPDPGSCAFLTPKSGMEKNPNPIWGMNILDHFSESLEPVFRVKK